MIIKLNETNRIKSDSYGWKHQELERGKKADVWRTQGYYSEFEACINGMVARGIRMISDALSTTREIQNAMFEVRQMAREACAVFDLKKED